MKAKPLPPSTESMEVSTGPRMAGPRTVAWLTVIDWDGSIRSVGEKTVPEDVWAMSPFPLMLASGVVPLEVEGPALKKPPATELAMVTVVPPSTLPPLRLGKVVRMAVIEPKLAKAPLEALAVPELAQV